MLEIYAQLFSTKVENEDVLLEKVQNAISEAVSVKAQLLIANEAKTQLENEIKALNGAKVKALVDQAIAEKKFGEDERAPYTELAESNFELANKVIGKMKGVTSPVSLLNKAEVPEAFKGKTWDDLHKSGQLENVKKRSRNYTNHYVKSNLKTNKTHKNELHKYREQRLLQLRCTQHHR